MGPAGEQSESRLRVLPAQDRLAPPLPLLPSRRRQRAHGGTFTSSSTCPGRGPSALWGRVTLPMLSLRTCLLRFENTKQGKKKQTKPIVLVPFVLWVSASGPTPGRAASLEAALAPSQPSHREIGVGWRRELALPFLQRDEASEGTPGHWHLSTKQEALPYTLCVPLPDTCPLKGAPSAAPKSGQPVGCHEVHFPSATAASCHASWYRQPCLSAV